VAASQYSIVIPLRNKAILPGKAAASRPPQLKQLAAVEQWLSLNKDLHWQLQERRRATRNLAGLELLIRKTSTSFFEKFK
jgi:hypothetical protein